MATFGSRIQQKTFLIIMIEACLFDLDGVIVDTAKYHYLAWRRLANSLGFDFEEADNEKLKGVSRMGSLSLILEWGGIQCTEAEKEILAARKNEWYCEYIERMEPDEILPGVLSFLDELKARNIRIGLGSASKNAMTIIERVKMVAYFECVIDGTKHTKSKPDPEVFELGARALGVMPAQCIVFEDAEKGVEAALNGGFYAVGVGSPEVLGHAHMVIPGFSNLHFNDILQGIGQLQTY